MLSPTVVLLLVPVESVLAAGSPPAVDAGANKVLAFPAKDLTLFGHATDPEDDPLRVTWTMTSGPASVKFSAPWALATTVTFTTSGTYTFQLAVSDGTSTVTKSMTVTVNPASSQTAFYVDPTFTGTGNGTAASPWKSFEDGNPNQTIQWNAINSALATNDVIIYFSARQAGSDTPEQIVGSVHVLRTDQSNHRLTLDGMSKYNTNDATPSWADYAGSSKMRISKTDGCCFSIGWYDPTEGDPKMHYVTMRGFEVSGSGARITWAGSHTVLEYIWSHDVTTLGATVQFGPAVSNYPVCQDLGKKNDITVRNNTIERGIGEGVYIAGTYHSIAYGGCLSYGNTHSDILIESNTVNNSGANGGQGDGIDLKAGLMHVTVRNNVITNTHPPGGGGDGIVSEGVFAPAKTNYLIEGNRIFNGTGFGIALLGQNGTVVRNNIIYNMATSGIGLYGDVGINNANLRIYNNTLYRNAGNVSIGQTNGIILRNNLVFGDSTGGNQMDAWSSTGIDSDYNLMAPTGAGFTEGTHSRVVTSTSGIVVNPANGDFYQVSGSPVIDKGADLSATGFAIDFSGIFRPQGAAWDIGAYEYGTNRPSPP
jgi:parallel beta-helix repeat protein